MDKLIEQIEALDAELKSIDDKQAAIETEAEKNGGLLSDEQRESYDKLSEQYDAKKAERERLMGDYNRQKARSEREKLNVPQRRTQPNSSANTGRIGDPEPNAAKDPKKGFETHREFLSAVMETGRTGELADERLNFCVPDKKATAGSDEQSTFADPYGGFLIPKGFSPNLLSVMAESDPLAGRTTQIPMSSAVVDIPARTDKNHSTSVSGGLRVYRRAEGDTSPSSRMEMEQVTLRAHSLFGVAYATEELLSRSPISFVALLEAGFRDEFSAKMMDERLNGSGVGMCEGVLTSPATVSVTKESGQAAATIVKENIDNMRARCWGYGNAVWLYNHDCLPQLRSLVQSVGTGGAPVSYFQTTPDGMSTLDGRPAFPTEFTKTLGTVGDLVLGNWSQYLEGVLSGVDSAESVHVRFVNHERTFKFWMENDGRCWWRSALTPRNSSDTLSPFVTLATRA